MQPDEFVSRVQQQIHEPLDRQQGEAAVQASLQVLGQTLSSHQARNLAAQLPAELKEPVTRQAEAEAPADAEEFRQRVAETAGISPAAAHAYADAVLTVLGQAVSEGEAVDVAVQVPSFVSELMAR